MSLSRVMTAAELWNIPEPVAKVKANRSGLYLAQEEGRYTYFIEWNRIDSPIKLIHWIRHLAEKNWVDNQVIEEMIDEVDKKYSLMVRSTRC